METKKNFWRKYWYLFVIALLLLLSLGQCECARRGDSASQHVIDSIVTSHKASAKASLDRFAAAEKQRDRYRDSIESIKAAKTLLDGKYAALQEHTRRRADAIKDYKTEHIQRYLVDLYKVTPVEIPLNPQGVTITDTIGRLIITDLIRGQGSAAEVNMLSEMVSLEKAHTKQLELDNCALEGQTGDLQAAVRDYQAITAVADRQKADARQTVVNQKRKTLGWKIVSGVLAAAWIYREIRR